VLQQKNWSKSETNPPRIIIISTPWNSAQKHRFLPTDKFNFDEFFTNYSPPPRKKKKNQKLSLQKQKK
jgi:hypothetical protein